MAQTEGVPFLGKIPTSQRVSMTLDEGEPFVIKYPDSDEARAIMRAADAVIKDCEGV